MHMDNFQRHPASFKDPAGFIFMENGVVYRQINPSYASDYRKLTGSGLLSELIAKGLLLDHVEISGHRGVDGNAFLVIKPFQLPFLSHPYEWSFDMLRDAALLTLQVNRLALTHGMILKDATATNIQFVHGKPVLIDTLSFQEYDPGLPWVAYRQFCRCFLFPLLINHYNHVDAQRWLQVYPEGIPLDMTANLLPLRTRFTLGTALHVHLQYRISKRSSDKSRPIRFSARKMLQLMDHLESVIRSLIYGKRRTEWDDYYQETILSQAYLREKEKIFTSFLQEINAATAMDLGANNGYFSELLAAAGMQVIAMDADPGAINHLYLSLKRKGVGRIQTLLIDLANPSPAVGWANEERESFNDRANADLVIALAIVHHLYFTFNIPLKSVVHMLSRFSRSYCIVEWVLPDDEKVKMVSRGKKALLPGYTTENFESHLLESFVVMKKESLSNGRRILYLLKKISEW